MLSIELAGISLTCRTHQGTEALHYFIQQPTGVIPGNGLFIIAGCTFLFLFCASKKEKEKRIKITECLDNQTE